MLVIIKIIIKAKDKDINLNNFIMENSLDIPLDVSIGVVSVPTGLNYSDQIKKVKEQNQHDFQTHSKRNNRFGFNRKVANDGNLYMKGYINKIKVEEDKVLLQ